MTSVIDNNVYNTTYKTVNSDSWHTQAVSRAAPIKRVRRGADEARAAILDAAEKQMGEVGPAGIRLLDVAREVGVSHPTVLHHFGSREGLIQAVIERSTTALHTEIVAEIVKHGGADVPVAAMLESAAKMLGPNGHARIAVWLALAGISPDERSRKSIQVVAEAAHAVRTQRQGDATPPYEDTYFVIMLASLALFGDAVAGHLLRRAETDHARELESHRFRVWLAGVMRTHLAKDNGP